MRLLTHMLYFFFKVRKWTTYMINLLINLSKICRERYLSSLSKETLTMVFNSIPTLTKVLRLDLITDYDERVRLRNKFIIENPEVVFWDYLEYHHETGYFKSSNRIISTEGNVITLNNKGLFIIKSQERPSSYYVSIQDPLKTISMVVHRAVASTFIPRPSFLQGISFEQLEVNHKDRIRNNNFTANLEWTTRSGNNLHATRMIDYQNANSFEYFLLECVIDNGFLGRKFILDRKEIPLPFSMNGLTKRITENKGNSYFGFKISNLPKKDKDLHELGIPVEIKKLMSKNMDYFNTKISPIIGKVLSGPHTGEEFSLFGGIEVNKYFSQGTLRMVITGERKQHKNCTFRYASHREAIPLHGNFKEEYLL